MSTFDADLSAALDAGEPRAKSNIGILEALRQAEAFIAEELNCRKRSMLSLTDPTCAEYIKAAEDALVAVRDAIGELRR